MYNHEEATKSMETLEKICNLIVTMLFDDRIPIHIREEYRQIINKDLKIIALVSYELMVKLSEKTRKQENKNND